MNRTKKLKRIKTLLKSEEQQPHNIKVIRNIIDVGKFEKIISVSPNGKIKSYASKKD